MDINISSKHFEIEPELRAFTEEQAQKLFQEFENPKLNSVKVFFSVERNWQIASVNVTGKNIAINAKTKSTDMKASLGGAMDKIDVQLRRYLDKIQDASVKADPKTKEKIWTSQDLSTSDNEFEDDIDG